MPGPDGLPEQPLERRNGAEPDDLPAGARFRPDPRLLAQGWDYRFVAGGPRLQETVQLYRQLGFEVLTQPVPAESFPDDCEGCQLVALLELRTIYTRIAQPKQDG